MLRFAAAAATSLALLITASGCGGDDPPAPKAEPTNTQTTPAASSSPTPPVLPAAAKADTKAGAKAFVRHFINVMNFAGNNGQTETLRALYARTCARCEGIADGIDRTYSRGGSIDGGTWVVETLKAYGDTNGLTYLDAVVRYGPQSFRATRNSPVKHFTGRKHQLQAFQLKRAKHRWTVAYLNPEA
jgi:hypothetical protein